jgi:lysophospholipase L1-like esterase
MSTVLSTEISYATDSNKLASEEQRTTKLHNVLIIGDSISIGYTPKVRGRLMGLADVHRPTVNSRDTRMGLKHLDGWLGQTQWDVIHFNWGLHDLCYRHPDSTTPGHRDKINGTISVSIDEYKLNLESLVQQLVATDALLIWANTTIVPHGEIGRISGDELTYNRAATDIMKRYEITTNDLFTLTSKLDESFFKGPGDVHYTEDGYDLIATQVTEHVIRALAQAKFNDPK